MHCTVTHHHDFATQHLYLLSEVYTKFYKKFSSRKTLKKQRESAKKDNQYEIEKKIFTISEFAVRREIHLATKQSREREGGLCSGGESGHWKLKDSVGRASEQR